jgi:hypothetical protein
VSLTIQSDNVAIASRDYHVADERDTGLLARLDWRFLFPHPRIGNVLFVGATCGTLWEALVTFSDSVTPVAELGDNPHMRTDLVVLNGVTPGVIARYQRSIESAPRLYAEVHNHGFLRSKNRPREWRRVLQRLGFDMAAYWPRHGLDSCVEYVPLGDSDALRYVFHRRRSQTMGLVRVIGEVLARHPRMVEKVLPHLSVVACKAG